MLHCLGYSDNRTLHYIQHEPFVLHECLPNRFELMTSVFSWVERQDCRYKQSDLTAWMLGSWESRPMQAFRSRALRPSISGTSDSISPDKENND